MADVVLTGERPCRTDEYPREMDGAAGGAWDDVGPCYDTDGAAAALAVDVESIDAQVQSGHLFALTLQGAAGRSVFPVWQFRADVRPNLPAVLAAAGYEPHRPVSGWTIALWLTGPDPDLGGASPLELLGAGDVERVVAAAADVRYSLGVDERREGSAPPRPAGPGRRGF